MITGKQIKIVKRTERHERRAALTEKRGTVAHNSDDGVKRDAVAIITGWVRELRQKKVKEVARGFESLFRSEA